MPELPEVETVRRVLLERLKGARVSGVWVPRVTFYRKPPPSSVDGLEGRVLEGARRRGKYFILEFSGGRELTGHLGMSGRLFLAAASDPLQRHERFRMDFGEASMRFVDPRRFGRIGCPLPEFGPEPLSAEFDGAWLHRVTRTRGAAIKHVLMDGHVVAGVGNIYANEALFRAGISPRTSARRLSRERCHVLAAKIRETLELAINAGGSSLRDYLRSDGMAGNFQSQFMAYDRAGEPCQRCGALIREIRQGQRSTFYCPGCQRR